MLEKFVPDGIYDKFDDITPEYLSGIGIRAVISDIDNTLAPYEVEEPTDRIADWISSLLAAGIRVALISNNGAERVERFNRSLGLPAYPDAGKPKRKYILIAMKELGAAPEETLVLGDQVFTDVFAGKRVGAKAFFVPPIRDKKTLFFRFKRFMERPFIKRYYKEAGK